MSESAIVADPRVGVAREAVLSTQRVRPAIGLVLGSGLGAFADALEDVSSVRYADVPHMPAPSVAGHAGRLCFGNVGATRVGCLEGRVHLYEGYSPTDVVFGCRLLASLGCEVVLLTNAAGGIRDGFTAGSLMLIADHLNLTGANPLVGQKGSFVDLTEAYDRGLRELARRAAHELGIVLHEGVYAGLLGPSYETPAEIRMLRTLGADAVGMSTVLEAIALRHAGVRVGALCNITNAAAGLSTAPLDHADVQAAARHSAARFVSLLTRWIALACVGRAPGRES